MNLPIIQNCDGCGACCFEQGSPPGYLLILNRPESRDAWPDQEDIARVDQLPTEAKGALREYSRKLMAGEIGGDGPCCWLDPQTLRCRWYDLRPEICRGLDVGSEGCRVWRDEYNVDVETLGLTG